MQQKEPENTKQPPLSCHGSGSSTADNNRAATPYFSFLGLVLAVFGEEVGEDVSAATGHVHQGALLPQAEARGNSQHQSDGLDHQGPFAQITPYNKPTQNSLDLRFKEIRVYIIVGRTRIMLQHLMKVTAYCTFENEALALVTMTTGFLLPRKLIL